MVRAPASDAATPVVPLTSSPSTKTRTYRRSRPVSSRSFNLRRGYRCSSRSRSCSTESALAFSTPRGPNSRSQLSRWTSRTVGAERRRGAGDGPSCDFDAASGSRFAAERGRGPSGTTFLALPCRGRDGDPIGCGSAPVGTAPRRVPGDEPCSRPGASRTRPGSTGTSFPPGPERTDRRPRAGVGFRSACRAAGPSAPVPVPC